MIEKTLENLIKFGTGFRYLQDVGANAPINMSGGVLFNINAFFDNLKELGFTTTLRAAENLRTLSGELRLRTNADERMTAAEVTRLKELMKELRPTFMAEAGGTIAYIVSERRYPIDKLIDDAGSLFGFGVFAKLPDIARQDFSECAKCLAFERPTAAAFHMLRATEATLVHYYCQKVIRKRVHLTWGSMIHSMRTMPKRFPDVLLNHLDNIRDSFRNPTAHPEKNYDLDEAQDLFAICTDVANRMVHDVK